MPPPPIRFSRVSGRSRTIALAATLLVSGAAPLVAQDCPATPWPTTKFQLFLAAPSDVETPAEFFERLALAVSGPAGRTPSEDAWARLIEGYLDDIAKRFESAGIGCPALETVWSAGELRYTVYLASFDEYDLDTDESMNRAGVAFTTASHAENVRTILGARRYFVIDQDDFSSRVLEAEVPGESRRRLEVELYRTLAHELFHMVQGTYDAEYGSIQMYQSAEGEDAVVEGGANGAAMYVVAQRFPGYLEEREPERWSLGGYAYRFDFLLAEAPSRAADASLTGTAYATGSFWFHLAERYGGLAVLKNLLLRPLEGRSEQDRIRWLDGGLRTHPMARLGLDSIFPHFLAELASYGRARYRRIEEDEWLDWVLNDCRDEDNPDGSNLPDPMHLQLRDDEGMKRWVTMARLVGRCVRVDWEHSAAPARSALQVEVAGSSEGVLRQVHVALATGTLHSAVFPEETCWGLRSSVPPGRGPSCVLTPDGPPVQVGDVWYRTWTLPEGDHPLEGEVTFVLANVAERAWETEPALDLELRFRWLWNQASMAGGPGSGGPTGADVDSALPIHLDEFPLVYVGPDPTSRRGELVCSLNIHMINGETGEGVELQMRHPGPIRPGVYDIAAADGPGWADPEEHPGAMVGAFGLLLGPGPEHPRRGGPRWNPRRQNFFFHSGSVEIESVSGTMLRGEVRANGWRLRGQGAEPPEEWGQERATARVRFGVRARYPGGGRSSQRLIRSCLASRPE